MVFIIDLQKQWKSRRGDIRNKFQKMVDKSLFVGTKKQAQESVKSEAERAGQFYINQRWLGIN